MFLRTPNTPGPSTLSISESLYDGQDYAEINRTLFGVPALRWLYNDEYMALVGTLSPALVVMKRESLDWLRSIFFSSGLKCSEDIYTLITSIVINDLRKKHQSCH